MSQTVTERHRANAPQRGVWMGGRPKRLIWVSIAGVVVLVPLAIAVNWAYTTVPLRNNDDPQVDALLVLGTPTDEFGHLTLSQRWRVDEAVREYRAGRSRHIVTTGGPTVKGFVEARVMSAYARAQGVPASALTEDDRAMTTVQNVENSARILDAHGWRRVEVISAPEHLRRAALILSLVQRRDGGDLLWQMHAVPTPGRSGAQRALAYTEEVFGTVAIRAFGLRAEPVLHVVATAVHGVAFAVRWTYFKLRGAAKRF